MDEPITGQTSGPALINMAGVSKNTEQAQLIDDLKKSLTEEMEKEYKLLQDLCDYCKPSKSEEKEKDKPVDDVKDVAAIKKFQNSPIAGSILIHHDFEKLFDILKGMTIGASLSSNNKKDEEKKGPKKKIDFVGKLKEAGQDVLLFFKSIMQVALLAPPLLVLTPVLLSVTLALGGVLALIKKFIIKNLPDENQSKKMELVGQNLFLLFKSVTIAALLAPFLLYLTPSLFLTTLALGLTLIPLKKLVIPNLPDENQSKQMEVGGQGIFLFFKSIMKAALLSVPLLVFVIPLYLTTLAISGVLAIMRKLVLPNLLDNSQSKIMEETGQSMLLFFKSITKVALLSVPLFAPSIILILTTLAISGALSIMKSLVLPNLPDENQSKIMEGAGKGISLLFTSLMKAALLSIPLLVLYLPLAGAIKALSKILFSMNKNLIPNLPDGNQNKKMKTASAAFKSFGEMIKSLAKSVLIIPLIAIPLLLSIPIIPLIKIFMKGMSEVSESSSKESKSFKKSILAFGLMAASLLLLSVGIGIAAKMGVFTAPAIKAIALSAVLMVGIIALGALAGLAKWGIIAIGTAAFLMGASFLMMSFALKILFNMDKEIQLKKLIPILASMLLIVAGMAVIGLVSVIALLPIAAFLGFSIALALGLGAFWLSMKLLSSVSGMMATSQQGIEDIKTFIKTFATGFAAYFLGAISAAAFAIFSLALGVGLLFFVIDIGLMKLISVLGAKSCDSALTVISTVAEKFAELNFLPLIKVAGAFAIFSLILAFGAVLFAVAMGAIKLISLVEKATVDKAFENINSVINSLSANVKNMAKGIVVAAELLVFGALLAVAFGAMTLAFLELLAMSEIKKKLDANLGKGGDFQSIYDYTTGVLYMFALGHKSEGKGGVKEILEATKNCAKLAALAIEVAAYTIPLAAAFLAMVSIFDSLEKLKAASDKIGGKEEVDKILSSVGIIFDSMATTAESFKGMSAKAIEAIGSLAKDVAASIGMLADTMIKIKDGIKEEEIAGATNKIKLMCLKMFGDGETDDGTYTLTKLFKTLSSSKLGKLRKDGVDALVPIVQAISLLADTVIKMGDQKIFSDERINLGMSNFQKISGLFSEFTNLCVGLRERQSGSTLFSKIFGDTSPLKAIKDLVEQNFFDYVTKAVDGFNMAGEQLANLNVEGLKPVIEFFGSQSKFFGDWIANSTQFSKGMSEIGKGLGHLKQKDVETFNNFLVTLKTGGNGISVAIQSLVEFANRASDFASIAKSFSSMSDSLNKISKNKHGFMDIMKSANRNKNMETVTEVSNQGKSSDEKILEKLTNLEAILESFVPTSNLSHVPGKGIKVYSEPAPVTIAPSDIESLS